MTLINVSKNVLHCIIIGVTGRVSLDENADRQPDYWVWSLDTQTKIFQPRIKIFVEGTEANGDLEKVV